MTAASGDAAPAVIVMARAPSLDGKTRLRSALSDREREALQGALLRDAIEVALEARLGPVHLAYTPAEAASWAEAAFGECVAPFPQEGDGLGERMLAALRHVARTGATPLVLIGADIPLLQPRHIKKAVEALADADVCLGPSEDGGYYLLACRSAEPRLFEGVSWGTNGVLETTLRLAREAGLRTTLLETLYDIDTPADLQALRDDLTRLEGQAAFRLPRHTRAALPR